MVLLSLTPLNQNQHSSRGWPFQGVFGLTNIVSHGSLRTRIGDDRNLLLASSIVVHIKCYETRINRVGSVVHTNVLVDRPLVLWQPHDSQAYAPIGDLDLPFRITVPPDQPGPSTSHMPDYRVFWRIEAVINHVPLVGQGTRQVKAFDLHFIRHDAPAYSSTFHVATDRLPSCSYSLCTPSHPIGPDDTIPISVRLFPTNPSASVSRVNVSIDRRMEFRETPPKSQPASSSSTKRDSTPLLTPPSTASSSSSADEGTKGKGKGKELNLDSMLRATKRTTSCFLFSSSSNPPQPQPDPTFAFSVPAPSPSPALKTTMYSVVSVEKLKSELEVVERDMADGSAAWMLEAPIVLPMVKPGHWAMGETMTTPLVDTKFLVSVKVTLTTPTPGASGSCSTEVISLPPQELTVVAISSVRRAHLLAKIAHNKASKSSRSKAVIQASSGITSSSATLVGSPRHHSRMLHRVSSRRRSSIHSPTLSTAVPPVPSSGKSKKRHREGEEPSLPSPPPSPADMLHGGELPTPVVAEVITRTTSRPSRLVIPPAGIPMESEGLDSSSYEDVEDVPFILTGDLSFQRLPRRRTNGPTSPRSPKLKTRASRTSLSTFSKRRPVTADPSRGVPREGTFQRATSVGAVSPAGVLLLAERMGGLMDVVGEREDEVEESPFSFAPPPESDDVSPSSSTSTVTMKPTNPSAMEREWEEELGRIESSSRMRSREMDSSAAEGARIRM